MNHTEFNHLIRSLLVFQAILMTAAMSLVAAPLPLLPSGTTTSRLAKSGGNIAISWTPLGGQTYTGTRAGNGWFYGASLMFSGVTAGNYTYANGLTDGVSSEYFSITDTTETNPGVCVTLVQGLDTSVPAALPRPALNAVYTDADYTLKVARVTDPAQVTDRDFPTRVRHEYSRRQPFNADSTRVLEDSSNGWFRLYQVNANGTLSFIKTLNLDDNQEPNWHPTNPNLLYFFQSYGTALTLSTYNVTTDQKIVIRDLGARVRAFFPSATGMWTKGEGRPSDDGRIWCLEVGHTVSGNFIPDGLISYNLTLDQLLGTLAVTAAPDHISTSPKGNYCVPSWDYPVGTRAYALNFSGYILLSDYSEHSDLALTKTGDEVYVYSAYDGTDAGSVMMVKLADGSRVPLFPLYGANHSATGMHISGTAKYRPGYAVVSFYGCSEDYGTLPCDPATQWFYEKVIAVELAPSPKIYNLAHDYFGDAGYFGETQAVASPDLTKVLFASSWESVLDAQVTDYLIQIPACALP